ncbi:ribosomal large subunit pseudouridine synthase D [Reticulomyxa filosa]|uniref:Ribosomal large subunit pseudouridine synthase D n=1 Tax=Reticulomyxa filosa TaxID=46433 RepID=X6LV83_RETFI|nr:ribosomal large subunit pseudouridine synthase D [Reticulomyxa filosa]|eukprot:ETO05052.1 ribosomal large subunit pseudouridine synthase D [Reticulomyxa filosa]
MTIVKEKKIKIFEKDFKIELDKPLAQGYDGKGKLSTIHSYGLFVMTKDIHKVFPHGGKHVLSYINCDVETSTTHQIHLQSQYLGLGVVSDKCYCQSEIPKYWDLQIEKLLLSSTVNAYEYNWNRSDFLAQHTHLLEFEHPIAKKRINFHCPMPAMFYSILQKLKSIIKQNMSDFNYIALFWNFRVLCSFSWSKNLHIFQNFNHNIAAIFVIGFIGFRLYFLFLFLVFLFLSLIGILDSKKIQLEDFFARNSGKNQFLFYTVDTYVSTFFFGTNSK